MKENTIKTSLVGVGLASVFSFALTACSGQEKLVNYLMDTLEDDQEKVVLSPSYGYYETALFGLNYEDVDDPENNFRIGAKTIKGHNKDGQSWACNDFIISSPDLTVLPKSFNNKATGLDYKIVFDLDQCVELPEGTIPRFPPGTFSA